jgi:hypothetical protein
MTIEIKGMTNGARIKRQVRARRFGSLAVYKSWGKDDLYTVGHIATGLALLQNMSHSDALEYAKRLQKLNWDFKKPDGGRKLYPQARKILDELVRERHPGFTPPGQ